MDKKKSKAFSREAEIVKTSFVGIGANVLLAGFKAVIGLISGSVAIVMDAVNNLSDALSSVITIVGMKLAGKPADKKHPFGYGRIEYLSTMIIAGIVLAAGISSFIESVKKIITPEDASFTLVSVVIIAVAVIVKLLLGAYFKHKGKQVNSDSLIASGKDASFDAIISAATLVSAIVMMLWEISVDGWLGALISVVIVKSGVEMLIEALNRILGTREEGDFTKELKAKISAFDGVRGAYDLVLHNYGPENRIGSVHIEIDDTMSAGEIHALCRSIQKRILAEYGVFLTVGIYAVNTSDSEMGRMLRGISAAVMAHDGVLQIHGLYVEPETLLIHFDIVMDFKVDDPLRLRNDIAAEIKQQYPGYEVDISIDRDYSD